MTQQEYEEQMRELNAQMQNDYIVIDKLTLENNTKRTEIRNEISRLKIELAAYDLRAQELHQQRGNIARDYNAKKRLVQKNNIEQKGNG